MEYLNLLYMISPLAFIIIYCYESFKAKESESIGSVKNQLDKALIERILNLIIHDAKPEEIAQLFIKYYSIQSLHIYKKSSDDLIFSYSGDEDLKGDENEYRISCKEMEFKFKLDTNRDNLDTTEFDFYNIKNIMVKLLALSFSSSRN